jgi:hypothetical protein
MRVAAVGGFFFLMLSYEEAGKALLLMDYKKKELSKAKLMHLSNKIIKKSGVWLFLKHKTSE